MTMDKDITLYFLAELETMQRIWGNKNASKSAIPFTLSKTETERNLTVLKALRNKKPTCYYVLRLFCIESNILSFNDIEVMEYEVNNSVSIQ